MKNATPTNAPDTTISIDAININIHARQCAKGLDFSPQVQLLDTSGKPFGSPRAQPMTAEEASAFQAAIQAAIASAANTASLPYLKRVYGFTPAPGT